MDVSVYTITNLLDIRIGPNVVSDTAFLVPRNLEDFITWTNGSVVKETIKKFNDEYDDYDEQNC
jgi:U3 small nucleolar ribonucleoprotein protein IMP3